jgi:hypothetical protein
MSLQIHRLFAVSGGNLADSGFLRMISCDGGGVPLEGLLGTWQDNLRRKIGVSSASQGRSQ